MMDSTENECTFCKIARQELQSNNVYEDEFCIAFLPIRAINPGHLILCPKEHVTEYYALSDEITMHLALTAKKLAEKIKKAFLPVKIGYAVAGFEVQHAHLHIIPLYKMHEITSSAYVHVEDGEVKFLSDNLSIMSDSKKLVITKAIKEA